jgi:hypothetical protein
MAIGMLMPSVVVDVTNYTFASQLVLEGIGAEQQYVALPSTCIAG